MSITVLCLLTFCGHSSSLISLDWDDDETFGRDRAERGMAQKLVYPFMAYIIGDDAVGCSGSIVSMRATLTAATCIVGNKTMKMWAGTNRLISREDFEPPTQHRSVSNVSIYRKDYMDKHDIGIAWASKPWRRSRYVRAVHFWIQTPLLKFEFLEPARVIGWGFGGVNITDRILRAHFIMVGSSVMCPTTYLQLQRNIMCSNAGMYQGVCKGDEGGAVVVYYPLVGFVVMAVVKAKVPAARVTEPPERAMDPTCSLPTGASMYTYVGYYRRWLLSLIPDPKFYDLWLPVPSVKKYAVGMGHHPWRKQGLSTGSARAKALLCKNLLLAALCLLHLPAEGCGC